MTIVITPTEACAGGPGRGGRGQSGRQACGGRPAGRPGAAALAAPFNDTRLQRWVVLTVLVPLQKEIDAYNDTFRRAVYTDQNDYPQYGGYYVQRVEAPSASEAAEPDWTKAKETNSFKEMEKALAHWPQTTAADVVSSEYIHEYLTFPLGPLLGRPWDASAAHAPEVPFLSPTDLRAGMGGMGGNGMMPPGYGRMPGMMPGMMPGGNGAMPRYPGMYPGGPGMMPGSPGMMPGGRARARWGPERWGRERPGECGGAWAPAETPSAPRRTPRSLPPANRAGTASRSRSCFSCSAISTTASSRENTTSIASAWCWPTRTTFRPQAQPTRREWEGWAW